MGLASLVSFVVPFTKPRLTVSKELFDRNLQHVDSIDAAVQHVGEIAGPKPSTAEIAQAADTFVRERFADGYSRFRFDQNWLAYLAGFVWDDLRVPVLPDAILKHRRGACSQQAIVFQAILERFGIEYASVLFPGHYASAAHVDRQWIYFDPHLEADQSRLWPVSALRTAEGPKAIYGNRPQYAYIQSIAGRAKLADVNRFPAPRGAAFETVTSYLSKFGWIIFLIFWAITRTYVSRRTATARPAKATAG